MLLYHFSIIQVVRSVPIVCRLCVLNKLMSATDGLSESFAKLALLSRPCKLSNVYSLGYFTRFVKRVYHIRLTIALSIVTQRLSDLSTLKNKNVTNEHRNTSKASALYVFTMPASGSANVQYGHVTDNKLSRQSHRKNRETIREFSCCNKREIISSFSHIVGKNAFFCDRIGCIMSVLCYMHVLLAKVHENVHRFFDNT